MDFERKDYDRNYQYHWKDYRVWVVEYRKPSVDKPSFKACDTAEEADRIKNGLQAEGYVANFWELMK